MKRPSFTLVAIALLGLGLTAPATADEVSAWLVRMAAAMCQMTYQGTFVYIQGDQMETMRITHVAGEDGVRERVVSLSGAPREVLRDGEGVRWSLGESGRVLSDSSFTRSFFPSLPAATADRASRSYTFRLGGETLIAGHRARQVEVLPRDHFRYGYSLWLEKHSGLLLKWVLLDNGRKPLARLMFTDLRLGSAVDHSELRPGKGLSAGEPVDSDLPDGQPNPHSPRWLPGRLPPGFSLTTHKTVESRQYEHLVYGDGLAAVSVYVEDAGFQRGHPEVTQRHGTTHVFTRGVDEMLVTVVGNVPAVTVELIGKSVAPAH